MKNALFLALAHPHGVLAAPMATVRERASISGSFLAGLTSDSWKTNSRYELSYRYRAMLQITANWDQRILNISAKKFKGSTTSAAGAVEQAYIAEMEKSLKKFMSFTSSTWQGSKSPRITDVGTAGSGNKLTDAKFTQVFDLIIADADWDKKEFKSALTAGQGVELTKTECANLFEKALKDATAKENSADQTPEVTACSFQTSMMYAGLKKLKSSSYPVEWIQIDQTHHVMTTLEMEVEKIDTVDAIFSTSKPPTPSKLEDFHGALVKDLENAIVKEIDTEKDANSPVTGVPVKVNIGFPVDKSNKSLVTLKAKGTTATHVLTHPQIEIELKNEDDAVILAKKFHEATGKKISVNESDLAGAQLKLGSVMKDAKIKKATFEMKTGGTGITRTSNVTGPQEAKMPECTSSASALGATLSLLALGALM